MSNPKTIRESLNELEALAEQSREVLYMALQSADNISRQNTLLAAGYRLVDQIGSEVDEAQQSVS